MSYIYFPRTVSRERSQLLPWRLFLFVNLLLFLALHWPLQIHTVVDDYNESQTLGVAGGDSSIVRQVALIVLCVVAIVGCSLGRGSKTPRLRMQGFMGWLPMAFVAWASMSTMWSNDLPLTLKRLVSFLILCVVAIAVAKTFTLRKIILWVFFTTAVGLVIAIFAELATGIFHPLAYGYRFSGIQHPNGEGAECGILALSGLVAGSTETQHRHLYRGFALLGFIFLVLSASRTAVIATLLAAAVYAITISSGKTKIMLTMPTPTSPCSPDSISGRTVIWNDVGPYIGEHPITGYGYQSFWTPARLALIQDEEQWTVPDSHSTYVDCLLTLGIVGLTLFALSLLSGLWQVFVSYRVTRNSYFAFLGGILIFCIINGFFESALGEGGSLTVLSLIVLARLAFVPPATAVRSPADTFSGPKEICPV